MSNVVSLLQAKKKSASVVERRVRDPQQDFIMDMASYCLDIQPNMSVREKAELLKVLAGLLVTTEDPVEALS